MANNGLPRNGLIALYDPWRDLYGRNILPVGSENFVTGWFDFLGATCTITAGQPDPDGGNNAVRIQSSGGAAREKWEITNLIPVSNPHTAGFSLKMKVLSGNAQFSGALFYGTSKTTNTWETITYKGTFAYGQETLRIGCASAEDSLDVLVYQPQINLGALYPYSPPAGLPQSLTDYTGHANNAQFGSTAGADTNDPKFNGVALVGDGVDDYAVVPLASAAYRISVVDSGSGYTVVDEVPAYLNLFKTGASTYLNGKIAPAAYYNRVPTASEIAQAKRYFKRLMAGRGVTVS